MVRITEDLIRKRAEHNECIISTLEEISLHQQDIEKIEHLDKWCRDLKILYLQSNLISKIENVGRLKKLEYLNLALNNIEKIENLDGCESLKKLDFTVNFIGELTNVESLKENYNLRELFLTGNPCTDYEDYRDYVIATLPQLQFLDGIEIEKSERILAVQKLAETRPLILQQERKYKEKRKQEIEEAKAKERGEAMVKKDDTWYTNTDAQLHRSIGDGSENDSTEIEKPVNSAIKETKKQEDMDNFWKEKVAYTPESRKETHQHLQRLRAQENKSDKEKEEKPLRRLQTEDGRILNVNEAKVDFSFTEEDDAIILDVAVFRHMDTSLCDVDVQPHFVKVTIKGKILQLVLPDEVKSDCSTAKRSQITGHLLITMPKVNPIIQPKPTNYKNKDANSTKKKNCVSESGHEKLEVDPSVSSNIDIGNICQNKSSFKGKRPLGSQGRRVISERPNSDDFVDDDSVPPLM